jgi:pimeloyl-ACP methyl ester carboxylesterase
MNMKRCALSLAVLLLVASFLAPCGVAHESVAPKAELVSVMTDDKVPLFYTPAEETAYAVLHIPGGPGAFYSAQDMGPLAARLNRDHYAFLTMNMRTAGNMEYARFEDYLLDVGAAIRLAHERGFSHLILLGHSLGSARAVYYLAKTQDPSVKGLVLSGVITSPYLEAQMRWNSAERARYDVFLDKQRARMRAGQGRQLDSYPWSGGRNLEMSAATWVDVFGTPAESNASTIKFADSIHVPVLIVHGSRDEAAKEENARQLRAALKSSPAVQLVIVPGANHLFIGQATEYADIVAPWVAHTMPLPQHSGP